MSAYLMVFSEQNSPVALGPLKVPNPFHCATKLHYSNGKEEWLGFQPRTSDKVSRLTGRKLKGSLGRGYIQTTSREQHVRNYVKLATTDRKLKVAKARAINEYEGEDYNSTFDYENIYFYGVRDCVTFARSIAQFCGFNVANVPILGQDADVLPYELVHKLADLNEDAVISQNLDVFWEK